MNKPRLSPEFYHLKTVARAAVDRGDVSIATTLFTSYTDEAKRQSKFNLKRIAAMKAQEMADVMALHNPLDLSRLPNPVNDQPPAWGAVKKRATNSLQFMRLNAHQQWAVAEIRAIYQATIRAVVMTMKPLEAIRVDVSRTIHDPLTYLERFEAGRLNRYFKWTWRNRVAVRPDLTGFELVCAVINDGYTLSDVARLYLPSGRSKKAERAFIRGVQLKFRTVLSDY